MILKSGSHNYFIYLLPDKEQFLNCISNSSRIVLLTIQELSKAQCNYTDYSDTDLILSCLERKKIIRYNITDFEAVGCLYCRIYFSLSHIKV